jgi:ribosomal protein S18 acetylase RimI-like enzyme
MTRHSKPPAIPPLFVHHPPPRSDGLLPVTITHLALAPADWTRRGMPPDIAVDIAQERTPTASLYLDLYDRVGRDWLWYERRLLGEEKLAALLNRPGHELHIARHDSALVGYFELYADEIVFFGLVPHYIGRRIGPWLLDRAIERGFTRGAQELVLNTNTVDHPRALDTYRKAGFRVVSREQKELQDPRRLWPDIYRWPPN